MLRACTPFSSALPAAEVFAFAPGPRCAVPLYLSEVAAGFPSPADDFAERKLDLNEHLVKNPQATFFVRAHGDSMLGAGIHSGDLLVVDRSVEPRSGDVVIAAVNGELTVKRIRTEGGRLTLVPENPDFPVIEITEDTDFELWGRVTSVVHKV